MFDDDVTAAAMIGRLVHNTEILALEGDCNRFNGRGFARTPPREKLTPSLPPRESCYASAYVRPLRATGENTSRLA